MATGDLINGEKELEFLNKKAQLTEDKVDYTTRGEISFISEDRTRALIDIQSKHIKFEGRNEGGCDLTHKALVAVAQEACCPEATCVLEAAVDRVPPHSVCTGVVC